MANDKKDSLSEQQASVIKAILSAQDTDLNEVMAILAKGGTADEGVPDKFCEQFQTELMETYSMIVGRPEVLRYESERRQARRLIGLLRLFRDLALDKP